MRSSRVARSRVGAAALVVCTLLLGATPVAGLHVPPTPLFADTLYTYVGAPQIAVYGDSATYLAVFEASTTSASLGAKDQFIGVTCSSTAGASWLATPHRVKLGNASRPMWRPVVVAQALNASVGAVFLYFSQYTGVGNASGYAAEPGGAFFQTSALIGLQGDGNCTLRSPWTPALEIWDTFGYASANPLVTAAMPAEWWNAHASSNNGTIVYPPSSWTVALSQLPLSGFTSYATLFVSTHDAGQTWRLASSTFSTQNETEAFSSAQLTGSIELVEAASSSASSTSSSSSDTDVGPLTHLAALLINGDFHAVATTASSDAGSSWTPLVEFISPPDAPTVPFLDCSQGGGAVDFARPIASAAYYSSSSPIFAYFPINTTTSTDRTPSTVLTVRQLGALPCIAQIPVGAGVTAVGMAVQAVWTSPRPTSFYLLTSTNTVVSLSVVAFNEAKAAAEVPIGTAVAITFCVVGSVYAVIVATYVVGRLRSQRAASSTFLVDDGQVVPPTAVLERQSLRRSLNERTILV